MSPMGIRLSPLGLGLFCMLGVGVIYHLYAGVISNHIAAFRQRRTVDLRDLLAVSVEAALLGGTEVKKVRDENSLNEKSKGKTKEGANELLTTGDLQSHRKMFNLISNTFPEVTAMYCPYCGTAGCFGRFCGSCGSNIECLAPFLEDVTESNEGIEAGFIHKYFTEGHAYEVILDFLEKRHKMFLSLRTLKRRLQNAGLTRRTDYTPIGTVHQTVAHELRGSGRLLGYRAMWQTLQQKYHLTVKREDVRQTISRLDPSGVQLRSRRRFVRRGYVTAGPNQVWHADGYDKLKPFGIAISGCIDGFSRKVMWLRSGITNNDPGIIAQYYLQCASEFGLLPARLRTDCGTENGTMAAINCRLRSQHTDDFAGALSHMYGTSTANQRIECWWSFFRKQRFGGRECGFPVSWEALHHFDGIMQASSQYNLCGDENLEMHFVDLQRRSGLAPPVNWTAAVQNYISMKNMSGV